MLRLSCCDFRVPIAPGDRQARAGQTGHSEPKLSDKALDHDDFKLEQGKVKVPDYNEKNISLPLYALRYRIASDGQHPEKKVFYKNDGIEEIE